jgi:hypothetical protein
MVAQTPRSELQSAAAESSNGAPYRWLFRASQGTYFGVPATLPAANNQSLHTALAAIVIKVRGRQQVSKNGVTVVGEHQGNVLRSLQVHAKLWFP